jgi:hypothetical protein
VPPAIRDKFGLKLPTYPGTAMCVKLQDGPSGHEQGVAADQGAGRVNVADMRQDEGKMAGCLGEASIAKVRGPDGSLHCST